MGMFFVPSMDYGVAAPFPFTGLQFRCSATEVFTDSGVTRPTTLGQLIQQLNDLGGSNHVTQTTGANKPVYVPVCGLTGKPAVRTCASQLVKLLAPAVSVNSRSFTFYVIFRPHLTGDDSYAFFNFGSTSALSTPMNDVAAGVFRSYLPLNSTPSQFVYGNPLVAVISGSASGIDTYVNNKKQTLAAYNAATVSGGTLFHRGDGLPFKGADIYEFGLMSTTVTATDVANLVSYAQGQYGVRTSWTNFFGASGDSLTEGVSDPNRLGKTHPLIVADALGPIWKTCNAAVSGQETPSLTTRAVWGLNQQVAGITGRKVFCYYGGTNDFGVSDVSLATMQTRLQTLLTQQTAAGFNELYVATILPRNDAGWSAGKETKRVDYNNWVRSQAGTLFNETIDIAADARLDDPMDGTYYDADHLHIFQIARDAIAEVTLTTIS